MRRTVKSIVEKLDGNFAAAAGVTFVLGARGLGKTTVLRQVAATLGRNRAGAEPVYLAAWVLDSALLKTLLSRIERGGLVLLIDDADRLADEDLSRLFALLTPAILDGKVHLVCAGLAGAAERLARAAAVIPGRRRSLRRLRPLGQDDAKTLLDGLFQSAPGEPACAIDGAARAELLRQSEGAPGRLLHLAKAVRQQARTNPECLVGSAEVLAAAAQIKLEPRPALPPRGEDWPSSPSPAEAPPAQPTATPLVGPIKAPALSTRPQSLAVCRRLDTVAKALRVDGPDAMALASLTQVAQASQPEGTPSKLRFRPLAWIFSALVLIATLVGSFAVPQQEVPAESKVIVAFDGRGEPADWAAADLVVSRQLASPAGLSDGQAARVPADAGLPPPEPVTLLERAEETLPEASAAASLLPAQEAKEPGAEVPAVAGLALPLPSSEPAIVLAEKDKSAEAASPLPEISGEAAIAGSSAALGEPVREMQAGTAPGATPAMAGVDQVAQATEAVETLAAAEVGDATPARLTAPSDGLPPPGGKRPADFAIAQIAALEARDREGRTPLVLAAMTGETAQVRRLLSQGADPNNWSRSHTTALMYAAWNGDGEAVEALLDWGADPHLGNIDGRTALMAAAIQGHLGVVERLLERDVAVDARGFKGTTALMYAAAAGRRDVIARLLASGADASLRNDEGVTALDLANSRGAAMLAGPAQRVERTR